VAEILQSLRRFNTEQLAALRDTMLCLADNSRAERDLDTAALFAEIASYCEGERLQQEREINRAIGRLNDVACWIEWTESEEGPQELDLPYKDIFEDLDHL